MDMRIADILRAKSKDEKNYLLKDHLKETILRAIQLRDFINQNNSKIKYKFDNTFFEDLIVACFLHDLGKINFNFQKDVFKKEKESDEFEKIKDFFDGYSKIDIKDHEVISLLYSLIFLDNDEQAKRIRTAILLHHYNEFYTNKDSINIRYVFDDYPDLKKYLEFLINNKDGIEVLLTDLLQYLLDNLADKSAKNILEKLKTINFNRVKELKECVDNGFGLSTKLKLFDIPDKEEDKEDREFDKNLYDFFVFLGALRRCDYSASGDVKIEDIQNLGEGVYKNLNEKIKEKVEKKEIWQEKILAQNDSDNLVLIAPTGSGKTEFALLWAKNRGKKLIYTLPLRVALNDLYWRFGDKGEGYFEEEFLRILHSTSFIEYLKEERDGIALEVDEKQTTAELFSSPLTLTTPDQVFLSSLKYYGFDKLVSIYPLSAIVIDEIQAYNPEMAAVIIKTLEIIKKLYGNLLIITATFPPYFEEFFNEEGFKIIDLEKTNNGIKSQIKNYNLKRHKIKLLDKNLFDYNKNDGDGVKINEDGFNEIKKIISDQKEKNILIIVNNVGKAIELFKKLEKDNEIKGRIIIKDTNNKEIPLLLHSRLIEKEKSKRINAIKEALKNDKRGMVLISTQLVEASVDIDFDLLITEAAPIDSQIQRWGRIYRNRVNDYNERSPNIFIFTDVDKGTSAIYDKQVIEKTVEKLKEKEDEILAYEDERKLISNVFEEKINGESLKDTYVNEIKKNLEWLKYVSIEKRTEAQRIFRRIAGLQVVIPQLMAENGGEIEKAFGEVIKDKNNWKLPWEGTKEENIVEKVKALINDEAIKKKVNKWKLQQIIYSYSFNLPIFSFERHKDAILEKNNFKGFFVLKIEEKDKKSILDDIKRYGVNKIGEKIDIDVEEIKIYENNIL